MSPIRPRWEWRTFRTTFGEAEARIRSHPGQLTTSRETYIVCDARDARARIRDHVLDVKVLQQTSREGLERWYPVLREPFPLGPAALKELFRIWGRPVPPLKRESYTIDEFLDEIVAPEPLLQPVYVRKQRHRFSINECLAEIAEVTFNGSPARTIGIEMPDAARVLETARDLGLVNFENVSYVKALRRFLASRPLNGAK